MSASFLRIPVETLEEILLITLEQSILGPPSLLHALLLTCRALYHTLKFDVHPTFYARIFAQKFDLVAPHRRLGIPELLPKHLKDELQTQCTALQTFRKVRADASYDHPQLLEAFRTAYLMLLCDDGKNLAQLRWAGLPTLVQDFLRCRFFSSAYQNHGWPQGNEVNTLAVTLFWFLTSSGTLSNESSKFRDDLRDMFTFAALRYPCFDSSEYQHSDQTALDKVESPPSRHITHPPRLKSINIKYFGQTITLHCPTLALYAILSSFVRTEVRPFGVPPHLPQNRMEAISLGIQGPTKADVAHFNSNCKTFCVVSCEDDPWDTVTKSRRHDPDWFRAVQYSSQSRILPSRQCLHPPGTFSGRWQGSFIVPCMFDYPPLQTSLSLAYQKVTVSREPAYFTLREHYIYSPSVPVPWHDDEDTFENGFLPRGCRVVEVKGGVNITDETRSFNAFYKTYKHEPVGDDDLHLGSGGHVSSESRYFGVIDIIITGETDHERGQAWGAYRYIGRIRPSDGLVVLLREPLHRNMAELGRAIFRGYLISSQNFIGRWSHVENPAWEAIFSLCKERDP